MCQMLAIFVSIKFAGIQMCFSFTTAYRSISEAFQCHLTACNGNGLALFGFAAQCFLANDFSMTILNGIKKTPTKLALSHSERKKRHSNDLKCHEQNKLIIKSQKIRKKRIKNPRVGVWCQFFSVILFRDSAPLGTICFRKCAIFPSLVGYHEHQRSLQLPIYSVNVFGRIWFHVYFVLFFSCLCVCNGNKVLLVLLARLGPIQQM